MDMVSTCKKKLAYFRIKELKDVLTQLGISKQGKKQDLLDRILALLPNEAPDMHGLGTTNFTAKQRVAEIIDDTYRKLQGTGATDSSMNGESFSEIHNVNCEEVVGTIYLDKKIRCPCGSSLPTEYMIQCTDPECRVLQHICCVIIPEDCAESIPPIPSQFYCEICRIRRADPFWETVAHPLSPVMLVASDIPVDGTNPLLNVEQTFEVTSIDIALLQNAEYEVQAWCILLNDKVPFRMQWPLFADLKVNGVPVRTINRPGSQLLGANGRDDGPKIAFYLSEGINQISLLGCDARSFCLGVRLVKQRAIQQILSLIPKEQDGEPFEDALARICRSIGGGMAMANDDSDDDLEVIADSVAVNLRCPMSGSRIKTAGRFSSLTEEQKMPGPTMEMEPVEPQSLKKLSFKSLKRALDLFSPLHSHFPPPDPESKKIRTSHKFNAEYGGLKSTSSQPPSHGKSDESQQASGPSNALALPGPENSKDARNGGAQTDLIVGTTAQPKLDVGFSGKSTAVVSAGGSSERNLSTSAIMERIPSRWPRPVWHAPWKNYRVISGHLGWVRSIAFDPSNTWFCTGSADRTIKIWDVGSGRLKLTLTGHIEQVRGLAVSNKHTYMFSAGDDKQVKCWDLEQNKVIRSYHGHLSGVYCLAVHPTIDILLTGGRDSVCRVWDIRSKMQIHALSGHENTVCSVFTRPTDPQVVTGSHDTTIKFWDLRFGKTMTTLTHHKKSVRAMALHPKENCFASASADNIKKFNLPKGEFMHNMLSQQKTIINAMAVNEDGVMATGGDNGSLWFWDWKSGHNFQQSQTIVQPGSLDSEAGIYALSYDVTGSRLVTCEADKTIKMWKEDENATPETHPLHFKPPKDIRRF